MSFDSQPNSGKTRLTGASAGTGHVCKLAANKPVACVLVSASVCILGPATFWTLLPITGEDLNTSLTPPRTARKKQNQASANITSVEWFQHDQPIRTRAASSL